MPRTSSPPLAEEINKIVELKEEAGELKDNEREMIKRVFSFSDKIVREVMTSRKDIISVREDASLTEVVKIFTTQGLSRVLVTGVNLDHVRGVLLSKDLIPLIGKTIPHFHIREYCRRPYFVAETKKIGELFQEFRQAALHFAVVLDEHGGVTGVVTAEDLLEEIVGEIFDEFDSPVEEASVTITPAGDYIIGGGVTVRHLNENYKFSFPTGEYDTMAGFLMHHLGRIPVRGEIVEYLGVRITVEEIAQNRIIRLSLSPIEKTNHFTSINQLSDAQSAPPEALELETIDSAKVRISGTS